MCSISLYLGIVMRSPSLVFKTDKYFLRVNSMHNITIYLDITQNISKISALLFAIFLSTILVRIRGEFLENFDQVERPILLVITGEITTEFEYHR